jgi:hypothetical protein
MYTSHQLVEYFTIPIASVNRDKNAISGIGTAFLISNIDGKDLNFIYLITTLHSIIPGNLVKEVVYSKDNGGIFREFRDLDFLGRQDCVDLDITILKSERKQFEEILNYQNKITHLKPFNLSGVLQDTGTEVFYLGFPYHNRKILNSFINNEYIGNSRIFVKPLIKRAFLMDMVQYPSYRILLDTINNPGFSGGPIIWTNREGKTEIIGVVSSKLTYESVFGEGFDILDKGNGKNFDIGIGIGYSTLSIKAKILEMDTY